MPSQQQQRDLRSAALFLAGQITPQRIVLQSVALQVFRGPLQQICVGGQDSSCSVARAQAFGNH